MSKKILLFISAFCILISAKQCFAQWGADTRLTNDTAETFLMTHFSMAVQDSFVHIVSYDFRDGNYEIYYKRSSDNGFSFSQDIRLTHHSGSSLTPAVAVSGSYVHVVWQDDRDGSKSLYYKRSLDYGLNWEPIVQLTNNNTFYQNPEIKVSGSLVHIVWQDSRDGNSEIYYKRSPDNGLSWGSDTRLTNNSFVSWSPSIAVLNSFLHVTWLDDREGNREIYYKRSLDGGISWESAIRLTNDPGCSEFSRVDVSGSFVHIVWTETRNGNREIYYKRSPDNGLSWGSDVRLTNHSGDSWYPSIAVSGSNIHVSWYDLRDGNREVYYKHSTDTGLNWEPVSRLTNDSAQSQYVTVAASGFFVHAVWIDDRDGNWELYYKRNPTGNTFGKPHINIQNTEIPGKFSLSQNYPNPFNPNTKINFSIPQKSNVTVKIYNSLGAEIKELVNESIDAGNYSVNFDASAFASGVYFYKITAGSFTQTMKMILIK